MENERYLRSKNLRFFTRCNFFLRICQNSNSIKELETFCQAHVKYVKYIFMTFIFFKFHVFLLTSYLFLVHIL